MKANEVPLGKSLLQQRRKTPKIAPLVALTICFAVVPIYYPYIKYSTLKISQFTSVSSLQVPTQPDPPLVDPLYKSHLQQKNDIPPPPPPPPPPLEKQQTLPNPNREEQPPIENTEKQRPPDQKKSKRASRRGKRARRSHRDGNLVEKVQIIKEHEGEDDLLDKESSSSPGRMSVTGNLLVKERLRNGLVDDGECDLFAGEWVENPEGPYYTNDTCWAIQEHQNCLRFGRPDRGFLKWRWKPNGCELPVFDPLRFLELVRGKSLAFVGDSVARNHMQSLICLLSRVAYPKDVSNNRDENFKRWEYRDYDFNISIFWSPYLVKTERTDPNDITKPFKLYLDEFDESWTSEIGRFDYVIISAGHWFFRPTMFYANRQIIGCLYCPQPEVPHRSSSFSYRRAFRTAFRAVNGLRNFKGIIFLRTFAPSHFEGGPWDKGGDCVRRRPFKSGEGIMEDYSLEMYNIQLQEYKIGERVGRRRGKKFRLMDLTQAMAMRPDGHPSKYGHYPKQNVTMANDCVHWCLPGPVDSWNDFLMELMRREEGI